MSTSRFQAVKKLWAAPLLLVLAACNPALQGECETQSDCRNHTVCYQSVCVHPDFVPKEPAPKEEDLEILSPKPAQVVGKAAFEVQIEFRKELELSKVELEVQQGDLQLRREAQQIEEIWLIELAAEELGLTSGKVQLAARAEDLKGRTWESPSVEIQVDLDPPVLGKAIPRAPQRSSQEHPALGAFVLGEDVVLDLEITDVPAGINSAPTLTVPDVEEFEAVEGEELENGRWRFRFNSRQLGMVQLETSLDAQIAVVDAVGNQATFELESITRITRRAWNWRPPFGTRFTAAPVIAGEALVLSDESGSLFAVDRHTGRTLWQRKATPNSDSFEGHLSSSAEEFFAISRGGQVLAWKINALSGDDSTPTFSCPGPGGLLGGETPAGGLALLTLAFPSSDKQESAASKAAALNPEPPSTLPAEGQSDSAPGAKSLHHADHLPAIPIISDPSQQPDSAEYSGSDPVGNGSFDTIENVSGSSSDLLSQALLQLTAASPAENQSQVMAYLTKAGTLRLVRRNGDWGEQADPHTPCQLSLDLGFGNQQPAVVPVVHQDEEETRLFLALNDRLVALSLEIDDEKGVVAQELWSKPNPSSTPLFPPALVRLAEDTVLVKTVPASLSQKHPSVQAMTLDGVELWSIEIEDDDKPVNLSSAPIAGASSVFIHARDGRVFEISLDEGKLLRTHELPSRHPESRATSLLLDSGATLYAASGPVLEVFTDGGEAAWKLDLLPKGQNPSHHLDENSLSLDCEGRLFVLDNRHELTQLLALVTDSEGLAEEAWPKYGSGPNNSFNSSESTLSKCP